eukprot:Gb_23244 [translate_table: standard]
MGRVPCCEKNVVKKGPWTPEEDQKLVEYIQKHGHESWRALPKQADIKRGKFSSEEEQMIVQLHALLGNKWSVIAAQLPGRTDNEIKNYWNSHLKKRLVRMGIDPVTHGPLTLDLNSLAAPNCSYSRSCHMTEWEQPNAINSWHEAEARFMTGEYWRQLASSGYNYNDLYGGDYTNNWGKKSGLILPMDLEQLLLQPNCSSNMQIINHNANYHELEGTIINQNQTVNNVPNIENSFQYEEKVKEDYSLQGAVDQKKSSYINGPCNPTSCNSNWVDTICNNESESLVTSCSSGINMLNYLDLLSICGNSSMASSNSFYGELAQLPQDLLLENTRA